MGFSGNNNDGGGGGGGGEGWGMGLLLVFFSEECPINVNSKKKKTLSSSSSSSNFSKHLSDTTSVLRSSNSNILLSRAQSTISICALLIFITLLLFTLCTFEPTIPTTPHPHHIYSSRRWLSEKSPPIQPFNSHTKTPRTSSLSSSTWISSIWGYKSPNRTKFIVSKPPALQRLGILFRRGTKAMNDLVICHVSDNVAVEELRLFLRLLHRSGLTSRSDVILIFSAASSSFESAIREENESFLKLVHLYIEPSSDAAATTKSSTKEASFDVTQFVKSGNKSEKEPLWGKKSRENHGNLERREDEQNTSHHESTQLSYGSVVGFDADELDPENALAGFMDHVPMSLRRWACYQMLLGRVRRNFKHVMLVDVKNSMVVRDPLGRVRRKSAQSVYLWTTKHNGRKNSDQKPPPLTSAVVMGGARGIRRLANSVLVEIVRSVTQHQGKNPVSESTLLGQLAHNGLLLKIIDLVIPTESIPEASSLMKLNSRSGSSSSFSHSVVLRGNKNHDFDFVIMKEICSYRLEFYVYENCLTWRS